MGATVSDPKPYYTATAEQYLRQSREAAEFVDEYIRRLAAAGVETEGGACFDEITCTSPEQARSVERIFRELCAERVLKPKEGR